jgi:dTDP-4-dehydrorhamnose 3,5-epimerase
MQTYGEFLPGIKVITHWKYDDARGNFCELWKINEDGMRGVFRQMNIATSVQNVLRGMHRQNQTKVVMPVYGKVFDVALDTETGKWFGVELNENNAVFIPSHYAHGYLVLSEKAIVQYVVDAPYNKQEEESFKWNGYNIDWPIEVTPILSAKDL